MQKKKIIDTIPTKNDIYSILTRKIEKGKEKFWQYTYGLSLMKLRIYTEI